jgi:hypothetical protein
LIYFTDACKCVLQVLFFYSTYRSDFGFVKKQFSLIASMIMAEASTVALFPYTVLASVNSDIFATVKPLLFDE